MEKINNGFKWVSSNFFIVATLIFTLLYARCFWLIPSIIKLTIGIIWISINFTLAIVHKIEKSKYQFENFLSNVFLFLVIVVPNTLVFCFNSPKVIDSGIYNGANYYLIASPNYDTPYSADDHNLTKWYGLFRFESTYVNSQHNRLRLLYDAKSNLVYVVGYYEHEEWLIFADSNPPRYYDRGNVDFLGHRFYISSKCINLKGYTCTFEYTMYQCELDNTGCTLLPFHYEGEEAYAYLKISEANQEIELYVPGSGQKDILVYSYGDHPRCHVEGCEILSQP